ncbi:MAG: cohesin domain-containing protein [bacterium]
MKTLQKTRRDWGFSHSLLILGIIASVMVQSLLALVTEVTAQDSTVSISGSVRYFRGDVPVDGVELILSGGASDTAFTDGDGNYQFVGLQPGLDYLVTLSRERDDTPISALDASLILRYLCGQPELDEYQSIGADVTKDGTVSAFDAAVILKYVVTEGHSIPEDFIGVWTFVPDSIGYDSLSANRSDQDYVGLICGDVSGNWRQPTIPMDTVAVWIPDRDAIPGESFRVYITVGDVEGLNIFSAQLAITYDESILTITEVGNDGTIYENLGVLTYSIEEGKISMAWAGNLPPEESGPLAYIQFQALPDFQIGQTSPLRFEYFMFNEGDPAAQATDGSVTIVSAPDIAVSDTAHDFGQAAIGGSKDWVLTVSNVGIEDLIVFAILSDNEVFTADRTSFRVPPDSSKDVIVTFAPPAEGHFSGHLTIVSNDLDETEVIISLRGIGVISNPDIEVSRKTCNFGDVAVHGVANCGVRISNVGTEILSVTDISSDSPEFTVNKTAFDIEPDSSRIVIITCAPEDEGPTSGNVTITSNDPDEPVIVVAVQATGVPPEATISVGDGFGAWGTSGNKVSIYLENKVEVAAMQLTLSFNSDVLKATEALSTPRTAHITIFGVNLEYGWGKVKLVITGVDEFIASGTGSVVDFYFDVNAAAPPGAYPITITEVIVADVRGNALLTAVENGHFFVQSQYTISGTVEYCNNSLSVPGVEIRLSGDVVDTIYTDINGQYTFANLPPGSDYCIRVGQRYISDHAVSCFDASLLLRDLCNVHTLSFCGSTAAEVTGDGDITAFDAAVIMRHVALMKTEVPGCGTSSYLIGELSVIPDSLCHQNLSSDQKDQNFKTVILGDVSQNWPGILDTTSEPQVAVSIRDVDVQPGDLGEVFIIADPIHSDCLNPLEIYSLEFRIKYDPALLTLTEVGNEKLLTEDGVLTFNIVEDQGVGGFGLAFVEDVEWCGEGGVPLIYFRFEVSDDAAPGDSCVLSIEELMINEGRPRAVVENGTVMVTRTTGTVESNGSPSIPREFALFQNRPNPFNPETHIEYGLPQAGYVRLDVYNVLGQHVVTLVDELKQAGFHTAHWDGRDSTGDEVPNGVYFCKIDTGQFVQTKKMVLLR